MKMQSPVFKKQGESVTKISSLFIFSMICHSVICYLMPIEIKKKTFKLLAWIVSFIILLCNSRFKCKYQSIELECRITETHNSYVVAATCTVTVSSQSRGNAAWNQLICFYPTFGCSHILHSPLPSVQWWIRVERKRSRGLSQLSCPSVSSFSASVIS